MDKLDVPKRFNFPFNHAPNNLSLFAASKLKEELHGLGLKHNFDALGKMFGVLVVEAQNGELGFIKAFSGKLDDNIKPKGFVPPLFDVHNSRGFFKHEEKKIDLLTKEINLLESSRDYLSLKTSLLNARQKKAEELLNMKEKLRQGKEKRKIERDTQKAIVSSKSFIELNNKLNEQSKRDQMSFKKAKKQLDKELLFLEEKFKAVEDKIFAKKESRKGLSSSLQRKVFESYSFLNATQERKNLVELFEKTAFKRPPSGAGECCAPRLLQFAYSNSLKPICFTEFWWGASPDSEIRLHNQHYPACRGKCGPILKHMLKGLSVDPDPLAPINELEKVLVLHEDEDLLAVEKPAGLLSVPGKEIAYSLASIIKKQFPHIEGPGLVHRLDYETSGVVLIAKSLKVYQLLQKQFTSRTIKKTYVAILQNSISHDTGTVRLPLRADIINRPRQLVCFDHGKQAATEYQQLNSDKNGVRVQFHPITGRTHQLRVHAAHKLGLNSPILGDSLYGKRGGRLFLHAQEIVFQHPVSGKSITVISAVPF
ncbi:pseudouridine synthase [Crocinitomicaceae bacterium]|nr:pseudouridine synthase [Crocinitomicaceae bacterium]